MRLVDPRRPEARIRLAYCLNVHPGETLEEVLAGIEGVTVPLARRFAGAGCFGAGLYVAAGLARRPAAPEGRADLDRLAGTLADAGLDPFTANAFPYGGFHSAGLKAGVFRPTWAEPERLAFTLDAARVLVACARAAGDGGAPRGGLSLSTHTGRHGPFADESERAAAAAQLARAALALARLGEEAGVRLRLALEPEPGASAGDTAAGLRWIEHVREEGPRLVPEEPRAELERALEESLGLCLDTCHSAVEFEEPAAAADLALGAPLAKLQATSALSLVDPAARPEARAALLALDEPRYLHQLTARHPGGVARLMDLPELAAALARGERAWCEAREWRCHFHVPLDQERWGTGAADLGTTVDHALSILGRVLASPERWPGGELHLEVETYTWDVLPGRPASLAERLAAELERVLAACAAAGWRPAGEGAAGERGEIRRRG